MKKYMIKIFPLSVVLILAYCGYGQTALEYFNSGSAKHELQNYAGAIEDYSQAIRVDPTYVKAYQFRGIAKFAIEDLSGAIIDFSEVIKLDSTYADAYYNRGFTKVELQDYEGAVVDFTKTIEINPKHEEAYFNRADAKYDLRDMEGVIDDLTNVIELNPTSGIAYYRRGLAKVFADQIESGCLDLTKAGDLGFDQAYEAIKKYCNKTKYGDMISSVKFDVKHGVSMPNGEPGFSLLMSGIKPNTEIMITAIDTTGARIELIPETDPIYADQNGEMIIDVHYGVKGMKPGACLFIVILDKAEIHQFTAEMPIVIPPTEAKKKWTLKFQD